MRTETLSRREREVMDVLYERERATALEIMAGLPGRPAYSAVRALVRVLEQKGHIVRAGKKARAIIYKPAISRARAQQSAVRRLLNIFFGGSIEDAVAALLNSRERAPTHAEIDALARLVRRSREVS